MTWTLHQQQQQRGAQLPKGGAPAETVRDRAAQDHEQAGGTPQAGAQAGDYPASPIENRDGDNTPSAGDPRVEWDEVVQPQPQAGETELEEDQRGDDAEQVAEPQVEQALDEAARTDRND